jgi:hypothetical protein
MGFFGALGKVLAGKPIYDTNSAPNTATGQPARPGSTAKVVPVVRITRVESPIQNGRLEVNVDVRNESAVTVRLDKIQLLGTTHDLDYDLRPGEVREVPVYSGPPVRDESNHYAEIQYRTESGDYFAAQHEVRYRREGDGLLHISECRLVTPIKDIYG